MRLTEPQCLSASELETIIPDMAAINHSSLTMTPLGELRYSAVPADEARTWLESCCRADLRDELRYPRISSMERDGDGLGPDVTRFEHLVIRDLDLEPEYIVGGQQPPSTFGSDHLHEHESQPPAAGRIVAYAEFKYHPLNKDKDESLMTPSIEPEPEVQIQIPPTAHRDLHNHWNNTVEAALTSAFSHLHCFEVRGLATLSPSHLRKGIASKLLSWIFPWADRLNVPVVLAATPPGYPLYLRHGFVELEGEDGAVVECDMGDWGGKGVHRHVLMVRRPEKKGLEGIE